MRLSRFATFAWGVLVYNLAVILWGAYVRASGSGAGCGSHWPLCNGEVIPVAPAVATMVEFAHRLTSGLALISAISLVVWAYRSLPHGHAARKAAVASLVLMITEALLGAGLVLFGWVARDESLARVFSMAAHLVNTFLLIGAMTLTAWWASGGARVRLEGQGALGWAIWVGIVLTIVVGVTGAVIALGDTLFYAHINEGGSEQSLSPLVETIKQIRIGHPMVAVLSSIYLGVLAWQAARRRPGPHGTRMAALTTAALVAQILVGVLNVQLQVPAWTQLLHLLLADLVWISVVLTAVTALAEPSDAAEGSPSAARLRGSPASS